MEFHVLWNLALYRDRKLHDFSWNFSSNSGCKGGIIGNSFNRKELFSYMNMWWYGSDLKKYMMACARLGSRVLQQHLAKNLE